MVLLLLTQKHLSHLFFSKQEAKGHRPGSKFLLTQSQLQLSQLSQEQLAQRVSLLFCIPSPFIGVPVHTTQLTIIINMKKTTIWPNVLIMIAECALNMLTLRISILLQSNYFLKWNTKVYLFISMQIALNRLMSYVQFH